MVGHTCQPHFSLSSSSPPFSDSPHARLKGGGGGRAATSWRPWLETLKVIACLRELEVGVRVRRRSGRFDGSECRRPLSAPLSEEELGGDASSGSETTTCGKRTSLASRDVCGEEIVGRLLAGSVVTPPLPLSSTTPCAAVSHHGSYRCHRCQDTAAC
jgi:hypothetical protein